MQNLKTKRLWRRTKKNTQYITNTGGNYTDISQLITLSEFEKYLDNGNKLLDEFSSRRKKILINDALGIMKSRHTYYVNIASNKQFITAYNSNNNNKQNARLYEMCIHLLGDMLADLVFVLLKHNINDKQILDFIKSNYKRNWDSDNKAYKLSKISDKISKYTSHTKKPKILDVGVGNGKKLQFIGTQLNCEIYGADIEEWGIYSKKRSFPFIFKTIQLNPYKIPYENNLFDCIILSLTLHHCEDIMAVINECKRILSNDGIIVIIEHDVWTDFDQLIIDIQHRIYECINNEKENPEGYYMNFFEWDIIFNKCDMYPVYADRIAEDISFDIRYDLQFISIYKKK